MTFLEHTFSTVGDFMSRKWEATEMNDQRERDPKPNTPEMTSVQGK